MLTSIGNNHHSQLPKPGELGRLEGLDNNGLSSRRRCQVVAFPLCDNVLPWSVGIHTVFVQFLDNGEVRRVSGFFFTPDDVQEIRPPKNRRASPCPYRRRPRGGKRSVRTPACQGCSPYCAVRKKREGAQALSSHFGKGDVR
jgi:hypothetical protein